MRKIYFKREFRVNLFFVRNVFKYLRKKVREKDICLTDTNLFQIYKKDLKEVFRDRIYQIKAGEKSKNLNTSISIMEYMCKNNVLRESTIYGFGGGVVGDITGFVAGIYKRGIPFSLIPTSLLSFVDSSIGGKTGVNISCGKNYVGIFNHPAEIIFDFNLLNTLPEREFKNGLFELLKYGFVLDREIYENFKKGKVKENLRKLIGKSIKDKLDVVLSDERERGFRKVLNFGHTFGHSIEKLTDYSTYSHGEAVAMGMMYALILGKNLKITATEYLREGIEIIKKIKNVELLSNLSWDKILDGMYMDKKITSKNSIFFVLSPEPGKYTFKEISNINILRETYEELLEKV